MADLGEEVDDKGANVSKIRVHFVAVGGEAPVLAKSKFLMNSALNIMETEKWLKKRLPKEELNRSYYFYCGSCFSPSPDQKLQTLFDCFQVRGELILQYGVREVWG